METLSFTATETNTYEGEYALVAGVSTDDLSLAVDFQRNAEGTKEDWGIHFGFNDQINGAYECIRQCTLSRERLRVELTFPIDPQKKISSVDIVLKVSDEQFKRFVKLIRRIFRQRDSLLTIVE